jgi:cobalt-zinc-cadmium efflux system outer membrane protein
MTRTAVLALVVWSAASFPALAQEEPVSLDDVIRIVREESPAARAIGAAVDVAEADVDLAGVYPNPRFSYVGMARFDGTANAINGSQHQVWIDFPILFGAHDARRDAAAATARAARGEAEVVLLALELEARRAYLELTAATDRARRIEAARQELEGVRLLVEGRAGAGAQSAYDVARVALELAQADADLATARADAALASRALATLAGRTGWSPLPTGPLEAHATDYGSVDELPSVVAARLRIEAADRDVHRAEMERIPELSLGAGAYMTSDGDSVSGYLGLSMPLPIFDTGEAAVRRAEAGRALAIEEHAAVVSRAEAALDGALHLLAERRAALEAFDAATATRTEEVLAMAEAAYRLGATGIFELLDAFEARLSLSLTRIELLAAVVRAEIDLLAIASRP